MVQEEKFINSQNKELQPQRIKNMLYLSMMTTMLPLCCWSCEVLAGADVPYLESAKNNHTKTDLPVSLQNATLFRVNAFNNFIVDIKWIPCRFLGLCGIVLILPSISIVRSFSLNSLIVQNVLGRYMFYLYYSPFEMPDIKHISLPKNNLEEDSLQSVQLVNFNR